MDEGKEGITADYINQIASATNQIDAHNVALDAVIDELATEKAKNAEDEGKETITADYVNQIALATNQIDANDVALDALVDELGPERVKNAELTAKKEELENEIQKLNSANDYLVGLIEENRKANIEWAKNLRKECEENLRIATERIAELKQMLAANPNEQQPNSPDRIPPPQPPAPPSINLPFISSQLPQNASHTQGELHNYVMLLEVCEYMLRACAEQKSEPPPTIIREGPVINVVDKKEIEKQRLQIVTLQNELTKARRATIDQEKQIAVLQAELAKAKLIIPDVDDNAFAEKLRNLAVNKSELKNTDTDKDEEIRKLKEIAERKFDEQNKLIENLNKENGELSRKFIEAKYPGLSAADIDLLKREIDDAQKEAGNTQSVVNNTRQIEKLIKDNEALQKKLAHKIVFGDGAGGIPPTVKLEPSGVSAAASLEQLKLILDHQTNTLLQTHLYYERTQQEMRAQNDRVAKERDEINREILQLLKRPETNQSVIRETERLARSQDTHLRELARRVTDALDNGVGAVPRNVSSVEPLPSDATTEQLAKMIPKLSQLIAHIGNTPVASLGNQGTSTTTAGMRDTEVLLRRLDQLQIQVDRINNDQSQNRTLLDTSVRETNKLIDDVSRQVLTLPIPPDGRVIQKNLEKSLATLEKQLQKTMKDQLKAVQVGHTEESAKHNRALQDKLADIARTNKDLEQKRAHDLVELRRQLDHNVEDAKRTRIVDRTADQAKQDEVIRKQQALISDLNNSLKDNTMTTQQLTSDLTTRITGLQTRFDDMVKNQDTTIRKAVEDVLDDYDDDYVPPGEEEEEDPYEYEYSDEDEEDLIVVDEYGNIIDDPELDEDGNPVIVKDLGDDVSAIPSLIADSELNMNRILASQFESEDRTEQQLLPHDPYNDYDYDYDVNYNEADRGYDRIALVDYTTEPYPRAEQYIKYKHHDSSSSSSSSSDDDRRDRKKDKHHHKIPPPPVVIEKLPIVDFPGGGALIDPNATTSALAPDRPVIDVTSQEKQVLPDASKSIVVDGVVIPFVIPVEKRVPLHTTRTKSKPKKFTDPLESIKGGIDKHPKSPPRTIKHKTTTTKPTNVTKVHPKHVETTNKSVSTEKSSSSSNTTKKSGDKSRDSDGCAKLALDEKVYLKK